MNRSILRVQRVGRVASRRCYSSEPEINHEPPLPPSEVLNTVPHTPIIRRPQVHSAFKRLPLEGDLHPSYKRAKGQFFLDTSHGPPVFLKKNSRPPNFIRPLLDGVLSAQQKANEELINSAADLGEEIVHPKLGKGYQENYRLLDNDNFIPITFIDGPDLV